MFETSKGRYLTRGVDSCIPLLLQIYMWNCVDELPEPRDYLQVFRLHVVDGVQHIMHSTEEPEYEKEHILRDIVETVTAKVYIIDDGDHCTMLLAEEY